MIHGNIQGVRATTLKALEQLYEVTYEPDDCIPLALVEVIAAISCQINREISVYLTRGGQVKDVTIGGLESVPLPDIHLRRSEARLAMVRCIHTHPGGSPYLSDVDISALRTLRLDAMAAVGVLDGKGTQVQIAFLGEKVEGVPQAIVHRPMPLSRIPQADWMQEIHLSDQRVREGEEPALSDQLTQRTLLVGMEGEESLRELERLAETAGFTVIQRIMQKRAKPDNATYIGSGKLEELALISQGAEADLVVFDDELTGAQTRNLERSLGTVEVIDRTTLILAIFAQRAQSYEGRLQVELAQLNYQLPRLAGQGVTMSQQGAGASVRSRGPGETRLELDRRYIKKRISDLQQRLDEVIQQRGVRRERRQQNRVPVVALVGYTNAGKSTLLNQLSGAGAFVEDKLFATLDPLTRAVRMPGGGEFLLVDTVGFIHKLPHALVSAFRSTLEEAQLADLLLIVSDASSPRSAQERRVVGEVLDSLDCGTKPLIEVANKVDLCPPDAPVEGVAISALSGAGTDELLAQIEKQLKALAREVRLLVPYGQGAVLSQLHQMGCVRGEAHGEAGTEVTAMIGEADLQMVLSRLGVQALLPTPDMEE